MTNRMTFDPNNQSEITSAAMDIVLNIESSLPKAARWFSNSADQEAFLETLDMITKNAAQLNVDDDSKEAITFWALTLLYAKNRRFRLFTASVKNWSVSGLSPIALAFVNWVGSNVHPGQAVAYEIMGRKMKEMMAAGVPEKFYEKTLEIARIKRLSPEDASSYFQDLFTKASEKYKAAGLSENESDEKALEDVLSLDIKA